MGTVAPLFPTLKYPHCLLFPLARMGQENRTVPFFVSGNVRIFYFFMGKNIILLHVLKKKTQELPETEIKQAKKNMKDFISRYKQGEFEL